MTPTLDLAPPPTARPASQRQTSLLRHHLAAKDSADRLAGKAPLALDASKDESSPSVLIDPSVRFQQIEGFGGAFTEAARPSPGSR